MESYDLAYSAELHEASLAAVRADIGVDMVECSSKTYLMKVPVLDYDFSS